ncbi:TPA: flagellar motor switch protein FliG [Clostridioides difficile]|uniref:flagellar motor switch protein FliG n=1 Tax=Clostridioides difficile TaxID=1496 RepID=UPI000BB1802F|nr:flagellar motor switch protein FliG [Clostridioides difficile]EGT2203746.1 flagellar motor switch protein FliG [Clostridioides difficile]EGT4668844.1 flagellar motor switch protein FliG [Clostridioides difficile]MDV9571376.1 flagellar motor switch protein FliG [Clostridioides difficile]MDV9583438.1 flagellar motor switch protein FliG [Clostridioides difficile]MDV9611622.1 flagellar motor switch protein FliG [Clostridioides difficile]
MSTEITNVNAFDLSDINESDKNEKVEGEGLKKAAVLLMTLGPSVSSDIIKSLPDKQVQKIGLEIANISSIASKERREILKEFVEINRAKDYVIEGGLEYARELLSNALGNAKANKLLEGISINTSTKPFKHIIKLDVKKILEILRNESAQTIAVLLVHMEPENGAEVLSYLDFDLQNEVAMRISSMGSISPEVIKVIESSLEEKLHSISGDDFKDYGGVATLVQILINSDRKTEKNILGTIEEQDPALAAQIKSHIFVFEDIVKLDDISIQKVLKEVTMKDLVYALKGVDDEISDAIYRNQSSRAADALKEEMEMVGVIKVTQVEAAQQKIANIVRKLEREGAITIVRNFGGDFVE